ncbi:exopolysaccharide biosynthesis protein [Aureimonas sp. SK2]|uniref:exopolysaccharide biosynthesis protein n=1 Tax=Aureimonas sp. SK2 TaxID=3015992 RepID=UPI002443E658|nr:exopolysaccharide biosynthesis protein [Aureimonas sp. SK2]
MSVGPESRPQTGRAGEQGSVGETLDELKRSADGKDTVTIRTVIDAFDSRSYGAFLLVPALLEISPIGGIPGVPTVIAAIIALFAAQILFGQKAMWLPGFLGSRRLSSDRLHKAIDKLRPLARFMDRWFHGRLPLLTSTPFMKGAALACVLLAFTVPPLELVPFASTAPMAAVAAFGLAMLVRDGALMVVAYALTILTAGIGIHLLFW